MTAFLADSDLRNDHVLRIVSNTQTDLRLDVSSLAGSPLSTITGPGKRFRSGYAFDNLELRGSASVSTNGDIMLWEGDISSNTTTGFVIPTGSTLTARTVDLNAAMKSGPGTLTATVFRH